MATEKINVLPEDIQGVMNQYPMFELQCQCMALIRMVEERDAIIKGYQDAALQAQRNHKEAVAEAIDGEL